MADISALKNRIRAAIKTNDNQEITGPVLQQSLLDIVDELNSDTETEASIRSNADNALQQSIAAEKNRAEEAEAAFTQSVENLRNRIDDLCASGFLYAGFATPSGIPNLPEDESIQVFYIAKTAGTYVNYGNIVIPNNGVHFILYDGTWSFDSILEVDDEPTAESDNLVKSGGIYALVHSLTTEAINVDTLPVPSENTIHKIYCTPASNPTLLHTKDKYVTIYDEIVPDYTNVKGLLTLANVPTDEDGAQIGDGTFIVNVTSTNKAYYVTIVRYPSEYGYIVTSVICEAGKYAKLQTNELYISNGTAWVVQPIDRIYKWESLSPDMSNYYTKAETTTLVGNAQVATIAEAGVFDVTAHNNIKFANLSDLLDSPNLGTLIPIARRKGGMSIKFVLTSDNKYVQYRLTADEFSTDVEDWEQAASVEGLENGNIVPLYAKTLEPWADQKAIATPDTYTDAVRTTGGDIPIETSAGSKLESIKPVAGSKWTAKMLFNGSYNMLNAAKWGAANSQPYVGGVGNDFVYFLVPELILGTFGTADENNGLLFTDSEGENVQPASVYYKPLGSTVPQSLTDGTSISPTSVSYDGKTYKDYATSGAGWLIVPKTIYDNDVCAHIAWEDWYDKYVSLDEPTTNPEAVVGILILEGLLALAHSDKYLRGVNDEVCDNVVFGDTSATISHMVDELSVAANAWTNAATGESDSQGNALYRHSATVSGIKQGGAACVEGEDGGIPLTVNGTTVSYVDTNATAPASVVFYEVTATSTTKAYTDSVFNGSNINTETGVLPINDCSIEAQVAMDGEANITVKYAKNIVDQVAINATVDVPQIKEQVENHEERITVLEDTAVRTGSYDASVAVGLADNFKGDTIVEAEFYKRKTGGTQSVGSGIAVIKEVRGKSIVWNQLVENGNFVNTDGWYTDNVTFTVSNNTASLQLTVNPSYNYDGYISRPISYTSGHKYYLGLYVKCPRSGTFRIASNGGYDNIDESVVANTWKKIGKIVTASSTAIIGTTLHPALVTDGYQAGDVYNIKSYTIIDLTLMFGAGNEPATAAEFEKMFPLDYYDYNEGEVIPFAGQNLVTIGFNQWDEQWEEGMIDNSGTKTSSPYCIRSKNFNNILPNTTYRLSCPTVVGKSDETFYIAIALYDKNKNFISKTCYCNNSFTTPSNAAFFRITTQANESVRYGSTYNNDICINISNEDRNGTYEPYEKHTLPLNPSQWRDKNGDLVFPYGGMHGVGTAYDYAKVDADGYIRRVVRCFEKVDLGSLTWLYMPEGSQLSPYFYALTSGIINMKYRGTVGYVCYPILCAKYTTVPRNPQYVNDRNIFPDGATAVTQIQIRDTSYTNAETLKTALNGVILYYELAEPVEVELATPVYAKYLVDKDGTEEITPANGTTPYTTMANLSILYAMDARGEIKNLPKNYLSKESAENMLNAMVSAGVIASYTMTYDATNARYQFTIVAPTPEPVQSNE